MKKLFGLIVILAGVVMLAGIYAWADEATPTAKRTPAVSQPEAKSTPVIKAKKNKKSKKTEQEVWACPMGDYSGPKTKDGKCPNCRMDLIKLEKTPTTKKEDKKNGDKPAPKTESNGG